LFVDANWNDTFTALSFQKKNIKFSNRLSLGVMMKNIRLSFLAIGIIVSITSLLYSQTDLQSKIESLPGIISVERIQPDSEYVEAFKIFIEQPVETVEKAHLLKFFFFFIHCFLDCSGNFLSRYFS
jgi:hypothetical protein